MQNGKRSGCDKTGDSPHVPGARLTRRVFLATVPAAVWAAERVRVRHAKGDKIEFFAANRLLFAYCYSPARPKTYIHPLCAPDSTPLTIDGPEDHVHHRGLMLAWSRVDGVDFWGETNPAPQGHGSIVLKQLGKIRSKPVAGFSSIEYWVAEGKVYLIERRTIRVPRVAPDAVWVEWTSELTSPAEPVTLSAEGHVYNGLGIRFARSMDGGTVLNSRGTTDIEKANGEPAAWCAYSGSMPNGKPATVAIFDHAENPRYPTPFFVMNKPFGYLSAAPTWRAPFELQPGQPLRLRYTVASFLGPPDRTRLDAVLGARLSEPAPLAGRADA